MFTSRPLDRKKIPFLSIKTYLLLHRIHYISCDIIHLQKQWGEGATIPAPSSIVPACTVSTQ